MSMECLAYTDGSCLGNPGPGGSGFLIADMNRKILFEDGSGLKWTTNNERELSAFIIALKYLDEHPEWTKVNFYVDSQYVINSLTKGWVYNWIRQKQTYRPNYDLWLIAAPLWMKVKSRIQYTMNWVKSHNVDELNERVDEIAKSYAYKFK